MSRCDCGAIPEAGERHLFDCATRVPRNPSVTRYPSDFFEGNGSTSDSHEEFFVQNEVTIVDEKWFPSEPDEVIAEFTKLLRGPTGDGAGKRRAGDKVSWKVDPGHVRAAFRHIGYWADGDQEDKDSGCHPLVHAAWRLLAVAWQENQDYVKGEN